MNQSTPDQPNQITHANDHMDSSIATPVVEKPTSRSTNSSGLNINCKFNIVVISGIPECDLGSSRLNRLAQDSTNVTSNTAKIRFHPT